MTAPVDVVAVDWYERRHDLLAGMVFKDREGSLVQLDRTVPGDGSKWYVADWCGDHWSYEDGTIEPGDLVEQVADPALARCKGGAA